MPQDSKAGVAFANEKELGDYQWNHSCLDGNWVLSRKKFKSTFHLSSRVQICFCKVEEKRRRGGYTSIRFEVEAELAGLSKEEELTRCELRDWLAAVAVVLDCLSLEVGK